MSVMKCPCCNSEKERPPYYAHEVTWSCSSCFFRCRNEDLPRIAAAMELAKWTIAINLTSRDDPTAADIVGKLADAEKRVLEVFNG